MAIPNVTDIYLRDFPRGKAFRVQGGWNTVSAPDVVITPPANKAVLIEKVILLATDTLAFAALAYLEMDPVYDFGTNTLVAFQLGINAAGVPTESLIGACDEYEPVTIGAALHHQMTFHFRSPIYCRASESEDFTISYSAGVGTTAGEISIVVCGWEIDEEDAGIEVDA